MNVYKLTYINNETGEVVENIYYGYKWPSKISVPSCFADSKNVHVEAESCSVNEYLRDLWREINHYASTACSATSTNTLINYQHAIESTLKRIKKVEEVLSKETK